MEESKLKCVACKGDGPTLSLSLTRDPHVPVARIHEHCLAQYRETRRQLVPICRGNNTSPATALHIRRRPVT